MLFALPFKASSWLQHCAHLIFPEDDKEFSKLFHPFHKAHLTKFPLKVVIGLQMHSMVGTQLHSLGHVHPYAERCIHDALLQYFPITFFHLTTLNILKYRWESAAIAFFLPKLKKHVCSNHPKDKQ